MSAEPLDPELTVLTEDSAAAWEALVEKAGAELKDTRDVPEDVRALVHRLAQSLEHISRHELASADPYLLVSLQGGAIQTLLSLDQEDALRQRGGVRIGLERMRQALRDVADEAHVSDDRPVKDVVMWLVDALDAPYAQVAKLLDTSPRTLQRWLSSIERVQPHGEDAARVKLVARVVNQLRHSMTSQGVIRWFESPHPALKGRPPIALVGDPLDAPGLIRLAAATRVSTAT